MKFNITHAAKAVGKTRRTLQNHIKQGKLSCELDSDGNKVIDAAELVRVYGELLDTTESGSQGNSQRSNANDLQHFTPEVAPILQHQIKMLERENEVLHEDKEELKQRLKEEREEYHEREEWLKKKIDVQALLLEDKREKEIEKPSSERWLVWALGGFTLIVGVTAMVAIYYLIQSGA